MEIKCQLDAIEVFIADLIACSTCFGHHYAHHQELKSIIQWLLPVVFKLLVWCGAEGYVSGLQDAVAVSMLLFKFRCDCICLNFTAVRRSARRITKSSKRRLQPKYNSSERRRIMSQECLFVVGAVSKQILLLTFRINMLPPSSGFNLTQIQGVISLQYIKAYSLGLI